MFWKPSQPPHLPFANGPYTPGCYDLMSDYGVKGVFMRLYYPTALDNIEKYSERWVRWLPDFNQYIEGFSTVLGIYTFLLRLAKYLVSGDICIPAVWRAEPVEINKLPKLPVIIITHGLGACRFFYSNLCTQLASYGYVVACLEHRDESAAATYFYQNKKRQDKDIKTWIPFRSMNVNSSQLVVRERQIEIRSAECSKALDILYNINDGHSKNINLLDNDEEILLHFKDRLDLSSATLMGHSFGGATALTVAAKDKRFRQMIILDSWLYALKNAETLPTAGADIPKLYINTETFQQPNNLNVMRTFINSTDVCYTLKATTHEHQCDTPLIVGMWLNMRMKKIDPELALTINANLILQFLQQRNDKYVLWKNEEFLEENKEHIVEAISLNESKL